MVTDADIFFYDPRKTFWIRVEFEYEYHWNQNYRNVMLKHFLENSGTILKDLPEYSFRNFLGLGWLWCFFILITFLNISNIILAKLNYLD